MRILKTLLVILALLATGSTYAGVTTKSGCYGINQVENMDALSSLMESMMSGVNTQQSGNKNNQNNGTLPFES